ncbi:MAG: sigma-70 family RNA polymerase sigma factor [Chloroflexota bacterium]
MLIRRAQRGDTAAFEVLVNHHAQLVYNLALRTLRNQQEAEDVAQEAFVRAWRGLPRFRADSRFQTWLYRIVTNLCYNRLPKLRQELEALPQDEVDSLSDERLGVETAVISREQRDQLQQAIESLPESYRLLITLRHLQQMSYDEIAAVMQMPLGTVKTGIFRARRQLRQLITDYERTN